MLITAIFYYLALLCIGIIGLVRYKSLTTPFKVLTWSVFVTFLLAILGRILIIKYKTNAPAVQLECLTSYVFYSLTYYYLFQNKIIKKSILISTAVITVCFVINAWFFQPFLKEFPSNVSILTQSLYAIFSLLLFKEMLLYPLKVNITKQSVFWYNIAILFFSTTMFFNLVLTNYFAKHNLNDLVIFYFWYFILFVFHILIGVSLLINNKEITSTYAR